MPKGIALTEESQTCRRNQIFEAAIHLFIEQGFLETSMREIAQAAGMGKSTLYDYFKTKDDILVFYFEAGLKEMTQSAKTICQKDIPANEKIRQIMLAHLEYLLANKKDFLKLSLEVQRLNMESQLRLQASRHAYQDVLCKLVEAGIAEGSFRQVDPLMAMRMILSALTPVIFTTRPTGTPQDMLATALDILFRGIKV